MFKRFFQTLKFKAMARQLRKPAGAFGSKVGHMMNKANEFLYDFTINTMQLTGEEKILEIGFGNGKFFDKLFAAAPGLHITGLDFSHTMVNAAKENNQLSVNTGSLVITQGSSHQMPFANNSFDKIFCINVIYFWDEPHLHLQEISRVLKPGGRFFATIRTKESMEQMPFTKYGFTRYNENEWKQLVEQNRLSYYKGVEIDEPEVDFEGKPFRVQSLCLVAEKK